MVKLLQGFKYPDMHEQFSNSAIGLIVRENIAFSFLITNFVLWQY